MSDIGLPHIVDSTPSHRLNFYGVPFASFTGKFIHHYGGNMEAFTPFFSKSDKLLVVKNPAHPITSLHR